MTFIFAGAGASRAVGGAQYPTTVEFYDRLPAKLRDQRAFSMIEEYLRSQSSAEVIDIERILWTASELLTFAEQLRDSRTIPGWFFQQERLTQLTHTSGGIGALHEMATQVQRLLGALRSEIQTLVYELYRREPDRSELEDNWLSLLELMRPSGRYDIFTTNYDVVIETALQESDSKLGTGRKTRIQQRIDLQDWIEAEFGVDTPGLLTKLHGSVDWARDGETIFAGTPLFQGRHERHVILYPGFKGVPIQEPFALFHRHLERVARTSKAAIFIGFAFRDEHINSVLRNAISRECAVVDINPGQSGAAAALGREVTHVAKGFNRAAIEEVASVLGTTLTSRYRVR